MKEKASKIEYFQLVECFKIISEIEDDFVFLGSRESKSVDIPFLLKETRLRFIAFASFVGSTVFASPDMIFREKSKPFFES